MDWPLIIFVLAVIAISLSYWWYRQRRIKADIENIENKEEAEE